MSIQHEFQAVLDAKAEEIDAQRARSRKVLDDLRRHDNAAAAAEEFGVAFDRLDAQQAAAVTNTPTDLDDLLEAIRKDTQS